MTNTRLILVGGFLGAGKTTLLQESARRLSVQGHRVGLITNDQAPDLVDTSYLTVQGMDVREVAGSCFCCDFPGLMDAADSLRADTDADVILAEPVGSCTDLSATIVQPLKDRYADSFSVAPLSVLVDPYRANQLRTGLTGTLHPSAVYILRKQLEEADWIVVNKVDQLSPANREKISTWLHANFPGRRVYWLSAQTGEGVEAWLADAEAAADAGAFIPDVDYDTYAEGEAVLGWLNAVASVHGDFLPRKVCAGILTTLRDALAERDAQIGHMKLILTTGEQSVAANLTELDGEIVLREGRAPARPGPAELIVNLRVQMPPEELEALCRRALETAADTNAHITIDHVRSLSPGRPEPTYRYSRVI